MQIYSLRKNSMRDVWFTLRPSYSVYSSIDQVPCLLKNVNFGFYSVSWFAKVLLYQLDLVRLEGKLNLVCKNLGFPKLTQVRLKIVRIKELK